MKTDWDRGIKCPTKSSAVTVHQCNIAGTWVSTKVKDKPSEEPTLPDVSVAGRHCHSSSLRTETMRDDSIEMKYPVNRILRQHYT